MRPEDVPAAHVIRLRVRENRLSNPSVVQEKDYHEFMSCDTSSWVCEENGRISGFIMVDFAKQNLWALFVDPHHEGKGIGRALHEVMISAYFRRADVLRLTTAPLTRAERFYCNAGYSALGPTKNGKELILELKRPANVKPLIR